MRKKVDEGSKMKVKSCLKVMLNVLKLEDNKRWRQLVNCRIQELKIIRKQNLPQKQELKQVEADCVSTVQCVG